MRKLCRTALAAMAVVVAVSGSGCTSLHDYFHNGFKVGPNYCQPPAPVAEHWIDQADIRVEKDVDLSQWWTVFNDPKLNELITCAYRQNLTLKEAGFRILQARANLGIAVGNIFPQQQDAFGDYRRSASVAGNSTAPVLGSRFGDRWDMGFSLSWELDFWGRFRRAVIAADDLLGAACADYDGVLVTLLGDVASNYVRIRTDQERIALLQNSVKLQQGVLNYIENRYKAGYRSNRVRLGPGHEHPQAGRSRHHATRDRREAG